MYKDCRGFRFLKIKTQIPDTGDTNDYQVIFSGEELRAILQGRKLV